jgi:hypothetical protein
MNRIVLIVGVLLAAPIVSHAEPLSSDEVSDIFDDATKRSENAAGVPAAGAKPTNDNFKIRDDESPGTPEFDDNSNFMSAGEAFIKGAPTPEPQFKPTGVWTPSSQGEMNHQRTPVRNSQTARAPSHKTTPRGRLGLSQQAQKLSRSKSKSRGVTSVASRKQSRRR